jgi:aminoglycoside/choline kinase family phosphotransferase
MLAEKHQWPFADFLSRSLRSFDFNVIALAGDASTRRYYRIVHENRSWVLMQWEPFTDDGKYPFLSVQRHFLKNGVHVPEVIDLSPGEGYVLLEDLGDLTLERRFWENQDQAHSIPYYKLAIDEIAKVHYGATSDQSDCTAFRVAFDHEKLLWEMNYGRTHLLEKFCELKFTETESRQIDKIFSQICTSLDAQEKFISHRDYHSRNLMIKFDKMRVIDFQDARMGPIQYDLVSLFKDSYVDLKDDVVDQLIEYYFEKRREAGMPALSRDQFNEIYEVQSIQRCFKACGSFASFYNMRNDRRYLKYLKHTLVRVKKSCMQFKKYAPFVEIIEAHGVFERDYDLTADSTGDLTSNIP